jgi:hypothetical protein
MGSTYDIQQTENSHALVKEAQEQSRKINLQLVLAGATLLVSVAALIIAIIAL